MRQLYGWGDGMNGADWLWMSLAMGVWLLVLGVVIYVVVRLASGDRDRR